MTMPERPVKPGTNIAMWNVRPNMIVSFYAGAVHVNRGKVEQVEQNYKLYQSPAFDFMIDGIWVRGLSAQVSVTVNDDYERPVDR